ncbi:PREDICTED: putative invertase inhibitor [Nelumbo nucifera]|uniref:Putative invertase inhibitor n=2 Tax=Nelumbo nucifera TaxID=4432 RepID=A0A1U8B1K8_NELNU|nr:PREDICTED: putative invertase inhibitor [Nelumbo nucifera]DAD18230.1 TPA_asm: hypothetical protein HUJ06_019693 [Nelumbo nucifera]
MNPLFSVFSLSFWLLPLLSSHNNVFVSNIIDRACRTCAERSPHLSYNFCVTSLQSVPESSSADLQGLGVIAVQLAQENATSTIAKIKTLLENEDDQRTMASLNDCLELYSDANSTLKNSIRYFESEDYISSNAYISAAMESASTCNSGFEEEGVVTPLTKESDNFIQLCEIALVISKLPPSVFLYASRVISILSHLFIQK